MVMSTAALKENLDLRAVGQAMYGFIADMFPVCRSITGDGLRETLRMIGQRIPIQLHEVPTGSPAFDWTIPQEWNIRDAYIKDAHGRRVVDFGVSNLHVMSYSLPIRAQLGLDQLGDHLYTLPDHPDWIPYRTSYYQERWGFCLTERQRRSMPDEVYEVCIDSDLRAGHLTYGELLVPGETADEVLISCHACHPSMANDNLSGVALSTFLAAHLLQSVRRFSYRFLFIPGTIGSLTWLSRNEEVVPRIKHGLTVACVGDPGPMTYKRSRRGDAEIDRAATHVLRSRGSDHRILEFSPYGYDERQYCSPGFDLPVGSLTRTPHGRYPEYHTSADDLSLVRPEALADSLEAYLAVIQVLEGNRTYRNLHPKGEPNLGKRGLYPSVGGLDAGTAQLATLWVLNQSDGRNSLLDVAERSGLPFPVIREAADALLEHDLLVEETGP
jgi:aminopeptidase-like protein